MNARAAPGVPLTIGLIAALALAILWVVLPGAAPDPAPSAAAARARAMLHGMPLALPSDDQLAEDLADAIDFRTREDFDRVHDAWDTGELIEHATRTQITLDRLSLGADALFAVGDELFEYEFRLANGLGNGLRGGNRTLAGLASAPNMRRVHKGAFGGPDSHNCAACHFKGGPDGAGTNTQNAFLHGDGVSTQNADQRNPPHLLGLGPVQALAEEMNRELQAAVRAAEERARITGQPQTVALATKGVSFGQVRVTGDGALDTSGVQGVDADLVIKPFGWKGHQATIRAMAEESFRIHLGIVSMALQRQAQAQAQAQADTLEPEVYGDGPWYDIDRDGVSLELEDGMLTTMVAYLAQLEVPITRVPDDPETLDLFGRGSQLFDEVGCASCHVRALPLRDTVIEIRPEQPEYADRAPIHIDVALDGEHPKIEPRDRLRRLHVVALFSDLKRHDMGPDLATPGETSGIPASVFLTRSLWGLADTGPYMHDGRAPTVHDAIRHHGGEAAVARAAYLALDPDERSALRVFLMSLTRAPKLFVH